VSWYNAKNRRNDSMMAKITVSTPHGTYTCRRLISPTLTAKIWAQIVVDGLLDSQVANGEVGPITVTNIEEVPWRRWHDGH